MERRITDNISELKRVLPTHITRRLEELGHIDELLEVVLDLGRVPTARYLSGEVALSDQEVTRFDLDAIVENIGTFDTDNRAGIERTLHRISAIRNRRGDVVGLTCRVGRAVYGTIDIIQDLVESGQSLLILGPPGVGKTTILRESARVLAENRRVVIVDTSNEIGGDGDVPHPAVGRARRMQVRQPELQHEVMIEAVENHNPEVIVIDEIGRELEALAARTIAERGVQLIGTAHGTALENLMLNPTLSDLIGGIHAVTLSDDEARRRGTQKTVLERKSPPTFDVLIEIQTRDRLIVHEDVSVAVDALLRGKSLAAEARFRTETGEVMYEPYYPEARALDGKTGGGRNGGGGRRGNYNGDGNGNGRHAASEPREGRAAVSRFDEIETTRPHGTKVFAYGVARNRLQQAGKRLHVSMTVVDEVAQADAIVTLKNYYRRRPKLIVDAERRGTPIYVLRANTMAQMEGFLADMFNVEGGADSDEDPFEDAMREVRAAILQVQNGSQFVDLTPQDSHIRRLQHQMARKARLESESHGEEPERRVRVTRRPA